VVASFLRLQDVEDTLMWSSVVAALLVVPLLAAGCSEHNLDEVRLSEQAVLDAGEIARRPSAYYGHLVTVVAEVEAVHGPHAFTLDDGAGLEVLVVVPKVATPVKRAREVTVHGTVRSFDANAFDRDYVWFEVRAFDPALLRRFTERPVIVADSIRDHEGGDLIAGAIRRTAAAE